MRRNEYTSFNYDVITRICIMNDIEIAKKYYYRFCEEFLTALKNIEGIKTALAWQNIDNPQECGMAMREAKCYKDIYKRAVKEVEISMPRVPNEIEEQYYQKIRKECGEFLDKIFPLNEIRSRNRGEFEQFMRKKGAIAEYLTNQCMNSFNDGYESKIMDKD